MDRGWGGFRGSWISCTVFLVLFGGPPPATADCPEIVVDVLYIAEPLECFLPGPLARSMASPPAAGPDGWRPRPEPEQVDRMLETTDGMVVMARFTSYQRTWIAAPDREPDAEPLAMNELRLVFVETPMSCSDLLSREHLVLRSKYLCCNVLPPVELECLLGLDSHVVESPEDTATTSMAPGRPPSEALVPPHDPERPECPRGPDD